MIDITNATSAELDALLPIAPIGRAPWSDLDSEDRDEFVEAVARFLLHARKYERNYYRDMWGAEFTEHRYAAVACSDAVHASYAHEYGRLYGMTHEQMLESPWDAVDAMLTYMN